MANYKAVRLRPDDCPEPYKEQAKQFISTGGYATVSIPWNCSHCGIPRGVLQDTFPTTWTPTCHCGENYSGLWLQYFKSLEERMQPIKTKSVAAKVQALGDLGNPAIWIDPVGGRGGGRAI